VFRAAWENEPASSGLRQLERLDLGGGVRGRGRSRGAALAA
jgi:hypothetical protein